VGAIFTYQKKKITFNFGAKASGIDFKQINEINGNVFKRDFINWLPQATFQYKISQQQAFRFNYTGSTTQPTIDQIQPVKVNNDPLNITLGNPNLNPSFTSRMNMYYNSYKVISGQSIYIGGNYSFTTNPIVNNSFTDTTDKTTIRYVNLPGKTPFNYSLYANTGRKIPGIDINAGLNASTNGSVSYSYINGVLNKTQTSTYSVGLQLNKYIEKKYDFYISGGPTYTINEFSTQPQNNNNAPGFDLYSGGEVYLPGKFRVSTNVRYLYAAKTLVLAENQRTIADASIIKSFFKGDNLKISLAVNNLFNQDVNFNRSVSANTITQTTSTSIKRYFMLSISWDFTKFATEPAKN
jgi:outer membrane receptor protein involved in Fe transport